MKFVCANADLVSNVNLDTDYDYITASSKSLIIAVETLANSFAKSKNDCVLFVWNTSDLDDLVRATEEASVENVNFKKIINDLEKNLDYSILGDFDLESIELENGMTISVVKYVTMNNFVESKKSARKSMKEQFVGKGKGGYRKPDKTKFNSGICLDSNGVKHTVIFDTRVEDFIVWVDDDNYLMWYVSSPQSLLNNLAESDLDENLILDIVALWEKLPKKRIKN